MSRIRTTTILATATGLLLAAGAAGAGSPLGTNLGPTTSATTHTYLAFYDGHEDGYIITDVSSKSQASALHVNYSPPLARYRGAPAQYFVIGKAAAGQLSVFGSEPGETSYNPLWEELMVTWKAGVKPVLLVKDDQIDALAKKGELTVKDAHVVLDAPITSVAK